MQLLNFLLLGFKSSAGLIMWVILILGFGMLGLLIERAYYLYLKCDLGSKAFMQALSNYLKAGDYEKAIKYALTFKSPIAKAELSILQNRGKGSKAIKKAVDEVFLTEAPRVK